MQRQYVDLSNIESVNSSALRQTRLDTLLHGFSPFEMTLKSSSDPIALDKKGGAGRFESLTDGIGFFWPGSKATNLYRLFLYNHQLWSVNVGFHSVHPNLQQKKDLEP